METKNLFKQACKIHTEFMVARFLMAKTEGRQDGYEQATRHIELCNFYIAVAFGWSDPDTVCSGPDGAAELFEEMHHLTQDKLTDCMDKAIGFPLKGRPNYGKLGILFFNAFHDIAMEAIKNHAISTNE